MSNGYARFCTIGYQNECAYYENPAIVWDGDGNYTIALVSQSLAAHLLDVAHRNNHRVRVHVLMQERSNDFWVYGHVLTRVPFLRETAYTVLGQEFSLPLKSPLIATMGRLSTNTYYENWQHYRHHYLFEMETQESRALCSRCQ